MMHSRRSRGVRTFAAAVASSTMLTGMLIGVGQSPAAAVTTVTAVRGYACGYYTNIGLFGGPQAKLGCPTQVGTTPAPAGPTTLSPAVVLPSGGSSALSAIDSDGAAAIYGPATIFGGRWPEFVQSPPPSGPITVNTAGTVAGVNSGGAVTASTDIKLYSTPKTVTCDSTAPKGMVCQVPGGFGPAPAEGDSLHVQCRATKTGVTGATTFVNAQLATATLPDGSPDPAHTEHIPNGTTQEPLPINYTRSGVITNVGDVFTAVYNEQIVNPSDGSLTVNAVHMYLFGPTAVGEMVKGQVICGTTPSALTPTDTVAPSCGTPVVEPIDPQHPTPKTPRTELVGVFDAGGLQSVTTPVPAQNATLKIGADPGGADGNPATTNDNPLPYLVFTPGQTGPLAVVATRIDETKPMSWAFDATDKAGNVSHCTGVVGGGVLHPLPPARILDTRSGSALASGSTLNFQATGNGGVPANAVAVVGNLTVVSPTAPGWMTVWPAGAPMPTASNVNFDTGRTTPNLVEVAVGAGGQVSINYGSGGSGAAHVLFDVSGYVTPPSLGPDGLYNPLTPSRIFDTRGGPNLSVGAADRVVPVTGKGGVPTSGVSAVTLNVTMTNVRVPGGGDGWLTVYPGGSGLPDASNLNYVDGQEVANRVTVPVGTNGQVALHLGSSNGATTADVIVDVAGWFTDASTGTGVRFTGISPRRILDTRGTGPLGPNVTTSLTVADGVSVPAAATAVVLNATVTGATDRSWLTVWPADVAAQPVVSDLIWAPGATRANLVVVKLSPDGKVNINNANGATNVIIDVEGWYG